MAYHNDARIHHMREVTSSTREFVIARWNEKKLRVEYLNRQREWVTNLTGNTLSFVRAQQAHCIEIPKEERKGNHIFLCKTFKTSRRNRTTLKLTKETKWHNLQDLMHI